MPLSWGNQPKRNTKMSPGDVLHLEKFFDLKSMDCELRRVNGVWSAHAWTRDSDHVFVTTDGHVSIEEALMDCYKRTNTQLRR